MFDMAVPTQMEVLMTYPKLHITNGPAQRDLELAFIGRNLGACARFTIFIDGDGPMAVQLKIYNFDFVTCHGPNYKLGGKLPGLSFVDGQRLPSHNWIFVEYNAEKRTGQMEFSNAE